jgi:two-component system, chemotaxis family, protein-glutamate methylesterase/glutaminase
MGYEKPVIQTIPRLIVIGGSAGSLSMVLRILPYLDVSLHIPIVTVFHRKSDDTTLTEVLSSRTRFDVKEIEDKAGILPNVFYVAPADYHVLIEKDYTFTLDDSEKVNYSRPSIDVTFESAADAYGANLTCILLSGANADGVNGLKIAKQKGSSIIIQDPASAEVPYMPQQAMAHVTPDYILRPDNVQQMIAAIGATSI